MNTTKIRTVNLSSKNRKRLRAMLSGGKRSARAIVRAQILLYADKHPRSSNDEIGKALSCGREKVRRVRNRFLDFGLEAALEEKPRPGQPKRVKERDEAFIIATACTNAPTGVNHWTVRLLSERFQKRKRRPISREAVRLILKNSNLKPWLKKNVAHSEDYSGILPTHA